MNDINTIRNAFIDALAMEFATKDARARATQYARELCQHPSVSHPSPEVNDPAVQIVRDIIHDLRDRRGLRQEWDEIDNEVHQEIEVEWASIVRKHLARTIEKPL